MDAIADDNMTTIKIPREYLSGWDTEEAEKYIEGYLCNMYFSEEAKEHLKFATENEEG